MAGETGDITLSTDPRDPSGSIKSHLLENYSHGSATYQMVMRDYEKDPQMAAQVWLNKESGVDRNHTVRTALKKDARSDAQLGFYLRFFVAASLPHGRPETNEFVRQAGRAKVALSIPNNLADDLNIGLPYGPMPRLILMWLAGEVRRRESRFIELGSSKSEFIRALGLNPIYGPRGNIRVLEYQLTALLSTYFTAWWRTGDDEQGSAIIQNSSLADSAQLWWDHAAAGKRRFDAVVKVSSSFYEEMIEGSFPVSMAAVRQLQDSSMALDIYSWLTYRFHRLRRPLYLGWDDIYAQFGAGEYSEDNKHRFKRRWSEALSRVQKVYSAARQIEDTVTGLYLPPSNTSVPSQRGLGS